MGTELHRSLGRGSLILRSVRILLSAEVEREMKLTIARSLEFPLLTVRTTLRARCESRVMTPFVYSKGRC